MNRLVALVAVLVGLAAVSPAARAADYRCVGNRVEKNNSTVYTIRESSSGFAVEKSNSTKGAAVKRGDVYYVEINNSTQATISKGRIEKNNSSWATVSDAKQQFDCPDVVAATLWVLTKVGAL